MSVIIFIVEKAARFQIDSTAQIPIDQALAALCDQGNIEAFTGDWLDQMLQYIIFNNFTSV